MGFGVELDWILDKCSNLFAVQSRTARIDGRIPVRGYAGHTGRLDVVVRSMLASLLRRGNCFIGIIGDEPKEKVFIATGLPPRVSSERDLFLYLMKCREKKECSSIHWVDLGSQYVFNKVFKRGFTFYYLSEEGEDYCSYEKNLKPHGNVFILGSHVDVSPRFAGIIRGYSPRSISIGPVSMHTSHVIVYISTILERLEKKLPICPKTGNPSLQP